MYQLQIEYILSLITFTMIILEVISISFDWLYINFTLVLHINETVYIVILSNVAYLIINFM